MIDLEDVVYRIVDTYDGPGCSDQAVEILRKALAEAHEEGVSEGTYIADTIFPPDRPYGYP